MTTVKGVLGRPGLPVLHVGFARDAPIRTAREFSGFGHCEHATAEGGDLVSRDFFAGGAGPIPGQYLRPATASRGASWPAPSSSDGASSDRFEQAWEGSIPFLGTRFRCSGASFHFRWANTSSELTRKRGP